MQHHLEVMGEKVRETFAFTDFESLEIHGEPNDPLKEWIARVSQGIAFTHHPVHWGGFTRLRRHVELKPRTRRDGRRVIRSVDARKRARPNVSATARPPKARASRSRARLFGARMEVSLVNDGTVTIVLDL